MNSDEGVRGHLGQGPGFGLMSSGIDVAAVLLCFVSVGYLFGFFWDTVCMKSPTTTQNIGDITIMALVFIIT